MITPLKIIVDFFSVVKRSNFHQMIFLKKSPTDGFPSTSKDEIGCDVDILYLLYELHLFYSKLLRCQSQVPLSM